MRKTRKIRDLLLLAFWLIIIALLNYIGASFFQRFDLTSEKRYSLSGATKELIRDLEDPIFVRVYLDGDLPAGFKRLRDATKEMLDEFRAYSAENIQYEFINPSESSDEKTRLQVYEKLSKDGLQYTNLEYRQGDKTSEMIIFPGAIFSYRDEEVPLQILKSQMGAHPEVMLNNSIQQLEYEIASSILKLTRVKREKIAFVQGHGELKDLEIADIITSLSQFYTVKEVRIDGQLKSLVDYDAIVIADPDSLFPEKDKFIIDQFIMNGGKALWLVEGVHITMDSLSTSATTMALPRPLNLEDMLFTYGVRVNNDLVMDLQALPIPIVTGYIGDQPQQKFYPWHYFPLLMPKNNHPIVKNLDPIKTAFAGSIDIVDAPGITNSILLTSSEYTKIVKAPTRVSLNMLREQADEKQFSKPPQTVAVLLEGEFPSVFEGRIPIEISENKDIGFKGKSKPNKMIIISDGDIIRNEVRSSTGEYMPLGYDRYTNRQYGNKNFIMNAVNYLCDDSGLIESRSKDLKLRLLNTQKINKERLKWQTINTALPVLLILIGGILQYIIRKERYRHA